MANLVRTPLLLLLAVLCCMPSLFAQDLGEVKIEKQPLKQAKLLGTVSPLEIEEDWSPMMRTVNKIPAPLSPYEEELKRLKAKAAKELEESYANQGNNSQPASRSGHPEPPIQLQGFFGNDFSGSIPNDNDIAISLGGQIVSVTNTRIYVFDVNGTTLLNLSLNAFGNPPGVSNNKFDPRVIYDPNNDRFIVAYLAGSDSASSHIILAFSQTNDATGDWNLYALNGNLMPGGLGVWTDYPHIGISTEELIITGNMFEPTNNGNRFRAVAVWQIPLAEGYAGGTISFQTFTLNGLFTLTPVRGLPDPYGPHMFLLNRAQQTGTQIAVYTLTGTIGMNGVISPPTIFNSPVFHSPPANATQQGTNRRLDSGDGRLHYAYHKDRKIHWVMGTQAQGRPSIYYGRINLTQAGLTFASIDAQTITNDTLELGFPNIVFAGQESSDGEHGSFIFFNTTSANHYPGNGVVFVDTADQVSDVNMLVEGLNYHRGFGSDTVQRWGDYTGMATRIDKEAWVAGYYAKQNRENATWISQIFGNFASNPPTSIEEEVTSITEMKAYPNPVIDELNIEFEIRDAGRYRANILDAQGKLVHPLIEDRLVPGTVRLSFNSAPLPNGMYILQVQGEAGEVLSEKFVVQH